MSTMPKYARYPIDKLFIGLMIGLSVFGLIVLLSASGPVSFQYYSDPLYFLRRQVLIGLVPGIFAFLFISNIDYRKLQRFALPALIISIILLFLVFIPGIGHTVGGSTSWIKIFGYQLQPSEFVKLTFLIYVSAWLATQMKEGELTFEKKMSFFGTLAVIVILLIIQPDTGSMFVISTTAILLYLAAGAPIVGFVTSLFGVSVLLGILVKLTPYRAARIMTFMHPELDPQGIGYHINQAFLAIGSGGLFGLGYGQSRQKYLYLPEVHGDSIFAVMAEELGFFVVLLFLVVVGLLVWKCFAIAREAPDRFGKFLAMGVGIWIGFQTFVNIASMTGLMPITGVTLPFVSYGNSSMLSIFAGLGIVAAISRRNRVNRIERV